MQLSVVVPVHNEAGNIAPLLAEIEAALAGRLKFEVIYVNDASDDDTSVRLAEASASYPWLRVIHHAARYGQSAALATGIRSARAPWVATLDGDGQNDPADILKLWALVEDRTQPSTLWLVTGYRRRRRDNWLRRLSSRVANAVRARLLADDNPDTGCGLKLIRRDVFLALPFFDHMHRFLPALVRRQGGTVRWVEVNHRARMRERAHYGLFDRLWVGIVDLFGVAWLQRRMKHPLLVTKPPGVTTTSDTRTATKLGRES